MEIVHVELSDERLELVVFVVPGEHFSLESRDALDDEPVVGGVPGDDVFIFMGLGEMELPLGSGIVS